MRVEEDEQVGGAVALVLEVVALQPARCGRDRLAHFTDELGRAFVEAHHRSLRIGCLGIEVEHILHARHILRIDLGNAPHVLAPGLEIILGQAPAHRLARQLLMFGQLDELIGQQVQCPTGTAGRRIGAGSGDQQGFLLAGQLALGSGARFFVECRLQAHLHEAALGAVDRGAAGHRRGDCLIAHAGIGCQQDLSSLELACSMLTAAQHPCEFLAFGLVEIDAIAYIHLEASFRCWRFRKNQKMNQLLDRQPAQPRFTHKQGQYLAFIWTYALLNRRSPAERDMQRFFAVTAPSVHQMLLTLERDRYIRRQPGIARSIELLVDPDTLPRLQPVISSVQRN